jgi:hypothetical protein
MCVKSIDGSDTINTLDTHTLLFTFLTGFRQNRSSWHTYFIVYFLDWVQIKSILTIKYVCQEYRFCLNPVKKVNNKVCVSRVSIMSELTFLTGFRYNQYSWHTYFIVYFPDWVQTKSILLTHILYCLLSWLGSDKIDTLDIHTLLFTF